ncbi:MAG TPA: HAD family hydrolase [Baekduia sp.]|nr:HAD family hydrolase [Baekduia sp.]
MRSALLFDLDDTLVVEEPAAVAAFEATARFASSHQDLDAAALATSARARARELWYATPAHPYCRRIGISSWEGLWCRFEGDEPDMKWLRDWSPTYRREAWRSALADVGVDDLELAHELGDRFGKERRARHEVFAEAAMVLENLSSEYDLALVTNGASCLQREKLAASGLAGYFATVVVSAEFGVAKPDPTIFRHTLELLNCHSATMIGDSIRRDIEGATAAGLRAIWVNRAGIERAEDTPEVTEITTLADLPQALRSQDGMGA